MCKLYKESELRRLDNSPSISTSTLNKFDLPLHLRSSPHDRLPLNYFGTYPLAVDKISCVDTESENSRIRVHR